MCLLALLGGTGIGLFGAIAVLIAGHRRTRTLRLMLGRAQHQTRHDRLTGLLNREAALDLLTAGPVGMVGLLDLDDFKTVNDRYGHHTGDQLLIAVAERLQTAIGPQGSAARLSGDEFVLIWDHAPADPLRAADALLQYVSAPITLEERQLRPGASLGLVLPGPHARGAALLSAADHAMYEAKSASHRGELPPGDQGGHTRLYQGPYPPPPLDRGESPERRSVRADVSVPSLPKGLLPDEGCR